MNKKLKQNIQVAENIPIINFIKRNYLFVKPELFTYHFKVNGLKVKQTSIEQKQTIWSNFISGSKASKIRTKKLETFLYYLQIITNEEFNREISAIKNIQFYALNGSQYEEVIGAFLSASVDSHNNNSLTGQQISAKELLGSKDETINYALFDKIFSGTTVKFFKDTIIKENSLESVNIDGLLLDNKTNSVKKIIEIKNKGYLVTEADIIKLHLDQVWFYDRIWNPSHGAVFVYMKGNRHYGIIDITKERLRQHDEEYGLTKLFDSFEKGLRIIKGYVHKDGFESPLLEGFDINKYSKHLKQYLSDEDLTELINEVFIKDAFDNINTYKNLIRVYIILFNIQQVLKTPWEHDLVKNTAYDETNYKKVIATINKLLLKSVDIDKLKLLIQEEMLEGIDYE